MNKFKMLAAALVAVATISISAMPAIAQGPGGHGGAQGNRPDPTARLTKELNLTPSQQSQLKAIFDNVKAKMQAMGNDPNRREKMQAVFKNVQAEINKILTPAQQEKMKAMGGMRGMGGGGGVRGLDQLNLSPAQKNKVDKIVKDMRTQMDAMRSDTKLSDADKQARRKEIRSTHMQEIMNVLTPEQRTKFQAATAKRGGGKPGGGGGGAR